MIKRVIRRLFSENGKRIKEGAGILSLLLMSVVSYVLFEYVTGNLAGIPLGMAGLNIFWIFVMYLGVFAVFGTTRAAIPAMSVFFFAVSMAEAFVVLFRGNPIMIWDVMAFSTAMDVAGNYVFRISKEMAFAAAAVAAFNVLWWFVPFRIRGWKKRLVWGIGSAGVIAGFAAGFYSCIVPKLGLEISMWSMNDTYQVRGYVLGTAISAKYIALEEPEGYSRGRLLGLYSQILERVYVANGRHQVRGEEERIKPVNLICIMNESLSDLKAAGDFSTNGEYFPFLNGLSENTVRGSLCVPVFGAMTSNTEFEFLTGDTVTFLPAGSNAYQLYVKPGTLSFVTTLKEQGYRALAMHPYPATGWNRDKAYVNLGFDEFISGHLEGEYYGDSPLLRSYVSDRGDYEKLIQEVEKKENPEDKLFIFNVTMQNHGGYEGDYENFRQEVWLTGEMEGKYPRTDQYLSLMKESDEAFQYLIQYFETCPEPTMIVMFGDHQPGIEDEFYDDIAGMPSSVVPVEQQLMWFETPFVIWTNYEQPSKNMGRLSSMYLSSYVLKAANLKLTPYNQFLLRMSKTAPVVHPVGCYGRDGSYYRWREIRNGQCPWGDLILDYECIVYNHILDRYTMEEWFVLQ